jgi:16S rRNA (adenine1518-N6/adenine1519-N6)-dimethyltransferase
MSILQQTQKICQLYQIKPARSKGQNFLIEEDFYDQIVEAADLTKDDLVLEVGPGLGFLTAKLAKKCKKVVAVELDDKLAAFLQSAVEEQKVENVSILHGNVLDLEVNKFSSVIPAKAGILGDQTMQDSCLRRNDKKYKIVANLPYNITSVFLRKFLSQSQNKPELMVLMLQKEVAERICAKPGAMSLLAVSVQVYAEAEIIGYVPAKAFWPAPEVDSAIIRIRINNNSMFVIPAKAGILGDQPMQDSCLRRNDIEKDFFRLVKFGFTAKRKMLKNNLAAGYHISQEEAAERIKQAGFKESVRAQELGVEDWGRLLNFFLKHEY